MATKTGVIKLSLLEEEVLLPCPFCGSSNVELVNTWTACYWLECECGAQIDGESFPNDYSLADHEKSKRSAIEKWNRRVPIAQ